MSAPGFALPPEWEQWTHAQREEWATTIYGPADSRLSREEQRLRRELFLEYTRTPEGAEAERAAGYPSADDHFERKIEHELERLRIREAAKVRFAEESAAVFATEWGGVLGSEFDPATPEPEPCVMEIQPGHFAFPPGIVFLFGARSALKTWLSYEAVVQEVRRGNSALLLDYEMTYEQAMRRLYILGMRPEDAERVVYVQPSAGASDAGRMHLRHRFESGPPSIIVIDSIGMAMGAVGLDSNGDSDTAKWSFDVPLWLKSEWPEAVILIIDHTTKASGGESSEPIGSQRKGAIADMTVNVYVTSTISREKRGTGRAAVRKDRKGFYEAGAVIFDYEFGGGGPFLLRVSDKSLVSIDLGEEGIARTKIAAYVKSHPGKTVENVRTALRIQAASFTSHKEALIAEEVIVHHKRRGLFPGPQLDAWLADQIVTDD